MKKVLFIIFFLLTGIITKPQNIEDLYFGTDSTLDIMTWNIERFPKNGQTTVDYVTQIIESLDVDVLALQEINDTNAFKQILENLSGYQGFIKSSWYAGLAYIYKSEAIEINDIYEIYTTYPYWNIFPRSPVVMELTFREENFIVINNHFKCCGDGILDFENDSDEEMRRFRASNLLKTYIDSVFQAERVIVVGDLNDILTDDAENNVFQTFIDDTINYLFADMDIATGSSSGWSYPGWPSHLDHILITNDLFREFENENSEIKTIKIDNYLSEGWYAYDADISDHRPVAIKIKPDVIIGFDQPKASDITLKASPNPVKNFSRFYFTSLQKNSKIIIFNSYGQRITSIPVPKGESMIMWKTKNIAEGIYLVYLESNGYILANTKIVIQ
ncbi:MAG: T9SS type A sorting domain-containing protein [Chlorobi bacterium]|nr:T9SS type A sorting domain-containing protein [Chlorobiota bacterium]